MLALDVEVADLAEIEQVFVVLGPVLHAAAVDVVRQVIDDREAAAGRVAVHTFDEVEVDVVDRRAVLVAVDQVDGRATDALDGGQAQLHRPGRDLDRLGALLECAVVGEMRIMHAKRHAARARAMLAREIPGLALRLVVDDEVDAALSPQADVLGTVPGDFGETEQLECLLEDRGVGCGKLDEFETVEAHGIVEEVCHIGCLLVQYCVDIMRALRGKGTQYALKYEINRNKCFNKIYRKGNKFNEFDETGSPAPERTAARRDA